LGALIPTAAEIATEYLLFGGAALISLIAFFALILVPALNSFGRTWEKATAAVVSLFVLAALLLLGVGLGVLIVYEWDNIADLFG
jgi:hypothetical protein